MNSDDTEFPCMGIMDLFHAMVKGVVYVSGTVVSGTFSPDFTQGRYLLFSGTDCRVETDGTECPDIRIVCRNLYKVNLTVIRNGTGACFSANDSVDSGTISEETVLFKNHRGFGFAFVFPGIPSLTPQAVNFLTYSLDRELGLFRSDIDTIVESVRRLFQRKADVPVKSIIGQEQNP